MTTGTNQEQAWGGDFGRHYTDRNPKSVAELDALYEAQFGRARTTLNKEFLGDLPRSLRILEVGCNVGTQLAALQEMGFEALYGIDVQRYALDEARRRTSGINLVEGSALDIPFKDDFFDLVFTSGVMIHISPRNLPKAIDEIHRSTRRWIWGFEYFSEDYSPVEYRGKDDLLWKGDFAGMYLGAFDDLSLVRRVEVPYREGGNVDVMFLLERSVQAG